MVYVDATNDVKVTTGKNWRIGDTVFHRAEAVAVEAKEATAKSD